MTDAPQNNPSRGGPPDGKAPFWRRRTGFTLIELLVVITIIALLIAILLPTLGRMKENVRRSHCLSNLHQWAIVLHAYAIDEDGLYPPAFVEPGGATIRPWQFYFPTRGELLSFPLTEYYRDTSEFWNCPNFVPDKERYGFSSLTGIIHAPS